VSHYPCVPLPRRTPLLLFTPSYPTALFHLFDARRHVLDCWLQAVLAKDCKHCTYWHLLLLHLLFGLSAFNACMAHLVFCTPAVAGSLRLANMVWAQHARSATPSSVFSQPGPVFSRWTSSPTMPSCCGAFLTAWPFRLPRHASHLPPPLRLPPSRPHRAFARVCAAGGAVTCQALTLQESFSKEDFMHLCVSATCQRSPHHPHATLLLTQALYTWHSASHHTLCL